MFIGVNTALIVDCPLEVADVCSRGDGLGQMSEVEVHRTNVEKNPTAL